MSNVQTNGCFLNLVIIWNKVCSIVDSTSKISFNGKRFIVLLLASNTALIFLLLICRLCTVWWGKYTILLVMSILHTGMNLVYSLFNHLSVVNFLSMEYNIFNAISLDSPNCQFSLNGSLTTNLPVSSFVYVLRQCSSHWTCCFDILEVPISSSIFQKASIDSRKSFYENSWNQLSIDLV